MNDPSRYTFLTTAIQAVGIMLVAGILLPMSRAVPGRFLRFWSAGWLCLTISLFAEYGSFKIPAGEPLFQSLYCVAGYLFGFLLWAGCREFVNVQPIRPANFATMIPLAGFGLVTPAVLAGANVPSTFNTLYPFHALVMGLLFLLALLATRNYQPRAHTSGLGLWLLRVSLGGLALLHFHNAAANAYLTFGNPRAQLEYLSFAPLYDVLLETGLAFGMVVVATDRLRDELEEKNRQLAIAAAELAHAARTDALTGLLNRRAFEELTHDADAVVPAGSLAVLDLNDLKQLNDQHGHLAGDVALQLVARTLRMQFRVTDPLFRTGGDEFVVVTSGLVDTELAARLVQVDQALYGLRLPGVAAPIDLIVSWGVASFHSVADLTTAFHRADEFMYLCKKQRKSGVVPMPG